MSIIHDPNDLSPLFSYLEQYAPLSSGYQDAYLGRAQLLNVKRSKFILSPIDNNACMYYIIKGALRGFVKNKKKDITTFLSFENEFIGAIRHPHLQEAQSHEYIQALEDCELIAIPYDLIDHLYETFPETNIIGRKWLALQYYNASDRAILARIPAAAERYSMLLDKRGKELDRVALRYLASYLGMRSETLSRIRNK
jgi:CRP-like cAMP-binding protein